MILTCLRPFFSACAGLRRALRAVTTAGLLLGLAAAPRAAAQSATAAEIAPAALPGKTVVMNATSAPAPFQGTGIFSITFTATTYTMPVGQGNPTLYSGTYTASVVGGNTQINLNGYLVGGSTVQLVLVPNAAALIPGQFEMFADGVSSAKTGTFTASGTTTGGGGTSGAPAITSATRVNATVGTPFNYQITASPAATSYTNTGGNAPVAISPGSGLVTGTFTTAGTFTFSFTALNSAGASAVTTVTVTATGGSTGGGTTTPIVAAPNIGAIAGTYSGQQFAGVPGPNATTLFGDFVATVTAGGVLSAQGGTMTGRVDASGNVTFDATGSNLAFGYTTGRIENNRLTATGQLSAAGRLVATYRLDAPRVTGTAATAVTAPSNLVGYRNRVGQTFEFAVTGATGGAVWGTDVYTDDSSIARAAVHAGVVAVGQSRVVTVTLLPGQSSYPASTRNGVTSSSWGSWSGSYSFAGAGSATTAAVATARPTLAAGFTAARNTLAAGGRLVLPIAVSGGGSYTYQWFLNGAALAGATANPYIVDSVGAAQAGTYSVDVTNALGTTRLTAGTITITSVGAPVIALQPLSKTVTPGGTFTMATNASGAGNAFQWFRNGSALAGETGAILLRQNATAADAGNYTVRVTNSAGTVTSSAGTVALSPTASRPANISVRASVAAGQAIIPGFFVAGLGTKRVIVRAVGPGLNQFNVGGTMADPKLELYRGSTRIGENDNWDGAAATTSAFASVGAFGLTTGSRDAVVVANLAAGESYTAVVSGVGTSSGVVLIEAYDADPVATSTSRLTNVSVRGHAGTGDSTLILGLVIGGDGQRTLLVRGVGPQLAAFGVTGALADPRLQIFDAAQRAVLGNDNWGQADFLGELVQASSYVGAFALEPGSRDAATLSLLDPGAYTIQLSGAGTATGEALVEVYEVP